MCINPVRTLAALAAAAILIISASEDLRAQSGRSAGGRSSSSLRQNYTGGGTQGQLPFSSGGTGRGSQAASGRAGLAQQGGMGRQAGQSSQQGPLNESLAQTGSERFQQGGFVGRDSQDVQQGFQNQGRRGPGQMLDQMIENLNDMRESRRRWREQNAAPPPVRVQLRPAFELPPQIPPGAPGSAQARLGAIMQTTGVVSPQVRFSGRTVTLRGTVATEHERALVGQLVALEPGVSQVENLLTIQTPPAAPQ